MAFLFLAFLIACHFLIRGKERAALVMLALTLVAVVAILIWEATTPLNLVF